MLVCSWLALFYYSKLLCRVLRILRSLVACLLGCLLAWLLVRPSAVVLNQHTCSLYVPLCFLNICFLCNQRSTDNNLIESRYLSRSPGFFLPRDLEVYNATLYQGHSSLFSDLATSFSRHSIISCTTARSVFLFFFSSASCLIVRYYY